MKNTPKRKYYVINNKNKIKCNLINISNLPDKILIIFKRHLWKNKLKLREKKY
jgi:hypothetical protein